MVETTEIDNSNASPTRVINPDDHPEEYAELMAISDLQTTYQNQLLHLRAGFRVQSQFAWEGHNFIADLAFVLQIKELVDHRWNEVTLLDYNDEPVRISDLLAFFSKLTDTYHCAINEYYTKYEKLRQAKTVEEMLRAC